MTSTTISNIIYPMLVEAMNHIIPTFAYYTRGLMTRSVAGPGARERDSREQEPAWPDMFGAWVSPSLQRFPDIQDPKTPLGP